MHNPSERKSLLGVFDTPAAAFDAQGPDPELLLSAGSGVAEVIPDAAAERVHERDFERVAASVVTPLRAAIPGVPATPLARAQAERQDREKREAELELQRNLSPRGGG